MSEGPRERGWDEGGDFLAAKQSSASSNFKPDRQQSIGSIVVRLRGTASAVDAIGSEKAQTVRLAADNGPNWARTAVRVSAAHTSAAAITHTYQEIKT